MNLSETLHSSVGIRTYHPVTLQVGSEFHRFIPHPIRRFHAGATRRPNDYLDKPPLRIGPKSLGEAVEAARLGSGCCGSLQGLAWP